MKPYTHNVVAELATRGLVPIFAQAQHGSTPLRLARALKAFGLPARLQKSRGATTPMLGGRRTTELTLFTSVEGRNTAALVVKAVRLLAKLHMVTEDRFTLGRVAERLHAEPELLAVFRAAYNLDADETTLEMILWPIKDSILPVPPVADAP
jgi:hypothetical protein